MAGNWNCKLVFAIIAAALGSGFQHGYHTGVINVPQAVLRDWVNEAFKDRSGEYADDFTLDALWAVTTSIMNLGGTIGGLLTGVVATKCGPKLGLLLNNVLLLIATILMGGAKYVPSFETMVTGRFVIGVNCGLNAGLCPMYLSEISPVALRGTIASVYQLVITISILIAQAVGLKELLGTKDLWPFLFILPIAFGVYQVITLIFCTESPRYLVGVKGNLEKAEASLKFLRNSDDVGEDMTQIKKEDEQVKSLPAVTIKEMFQKRHLRVPLIIALMIMLAQQLSGINAVIFFSTDTFTRAGLTEFDAQLATIGIGIVNVLMTIVSVFIVDIAGRKTLLLVGFGGMAIDTTLLSVCLYLSKDSKVFAYICIVLVYIYIILFAAGAGSIPWFLVTEIFNQAARPTAVSLAVPTNWIANFLVTITFPNLQAKIESWVFLIFAALDVLFSLFIWRKVPETRGRTIDDITSQWKD